MTYFNAVKFICSHSAPQGEWECKSLPLLLARLGNPQKKIKYVRLAGSNGKTVCAEMLMSVLADSAYKAGYLRMPANEDPRENVCIGGEPIPVDEFCPLVQQVKVEIEALRTELDETGGADAVFSSAEVLLCVALLAFYKQHCDVCFIESDHFGVDPSMLLPPPFAAVICGTIPSGDEREISRIRSYICRGTEEIVSAPQDSDAYKIIFDACYDINCRFTLPVRTEIAVNRLSLGGTDFSYKGREYSIGLCGRFQVSNAVLALEVLEMLSRKGFAVDYESVVTGFGRLRIPAKVEIISLRPLIIADTTHTPVAVRTVCESIFEIIGKTDKNVRLCLPTLDLAEEYIEVISENGSMVERLVLPFAEGDKQTERNVVYAKTAKAFVSASLDGLDNNTVLIISGDYSFVTPIRYKLLATLGF